MNETLSTIEGRPTLRLERVIRHSVERVWTAITDPEQLGKWYPAKVISMDFTPGGRIRFDYGGGMILLATIIEIDAPRVFAFSETPPKEFFRESANLVRIELEPHPKGCLLTFTHTFSDRPAAASYTTGWNACLDQLGPIFDGDAVEPTDMGVVHEYWIKQFGLDEGRIVTEGGTTSVRFERQLMMQPRGKAWSVIAQGDHLQPGTMTPPLLVPAGLSVGPITEIELETRIDYNDAQGGRVNWGFSDGAGGVRIDLVHVSSRAPELLDSWKNCMESLVARIVAADYESGA